MTKAAAGRELFVNKPRAYAVLEQLHLDGLVALNPINVYYLTNTRPIFTKFGRDTPAFATFARDPSQPSFLVAHIHETQNCLTGDRDYPPIIAYSAMRNWQDHLDDDEPRAPDPAPSHFPVGPYSLTGREQNWIDAHTMHAARLAPTAAWGLARALTESGLAKARLAVDDMRIATLLQQVGMTGVTCVPGEQVFRKIRMVKSDAEVAMMRVAGDNNAVATMNTIRAIEPGMRFEQVEQIFRLECAKLGANIVSFLAGIQLGGFPDDHTVAGKPFMIDAVSHTAGYHGDFARTVVLGEPSKKVLSRAAANKAGRDAFLERVRPGVRFSELKRVAREAQIKSGMPEAIIIVNAHTVGLEHDDNAARLDVPFDVPDDVVLEENMVLTVDLPYFEIGWGGGHHEDLLLVTSHGFEPLNTPGDPLVIV